MVPNKSGRVEKMTSQNGSHVAESEELRQAVEQIARRLAEVEGQLARKRRSPPGRALSDAHLADIAESIYRARRRRERYFSPELFAEPAWDFLLDLFISKARTQRVSTTSVTEAAGVPIATGHRWLSHLEKQGLMRRYAAPDDARLTLLELTDKGYRLMHSYVTEGMDRAEVPVPSLN